MQAMLSQGSKAHIDTIGSDLQIRIKGPINWFVVIFMSVWLFFWAIGELVVLNILIGIFMPPPLDIGFSLFDFGELMGPGGIMLAFLLIWFIFWTRGGISAFRVLLTMLAGSEVIGVNSAGITLSRQIFGFGFPKVFASEKITSLRLANKEDRRYRTRSLGRGGGALAFDHNYDTVTFGEGLKRDGAEEIIRAIGGRFSYYLRGAA